MRFISKFCDFYPVNEATLGEDKIGTDYILSRHGRTFTSKFGISENITLRHTEKRPRAGEDVLWIKSSSLQVIKFKDLKLIIGDDLMVYQTTSKTLPWAVARKGSSSTMVKQRLKEGASKRGEHFRESAFIITLALEAWKIRGIRIPVITNRGLLKMEYKDRGVAHISDRRGEFKKEYDTFMASNLPVSRNMKRQCRDLIEYIGDDIKNISYIVKNTSDLLINKMTSSFIKDDSLELPPRTSLAKWNPSDIWIVFKGSEWTMEHDFEYKSHDINSLSELNEFLMWSIVGVDGLIGVSLKQASDKESKSGIKFKKTLSMINVDQDLVTHKYDGYSIEGYRKTVIMDFSFKFGTGKWINGGQIHCRTFDTTNKSGISLEVKGSKKSEHMSGKAGSILQTLMLPELFDLKERIRLAVDKKEISEMMKGFDFSNPDLKKIFEFDLKDGVKKSANQNSRMQSIIVIEWLESLSDKDADNMISKIIKFAKSESVWSAAHLLVSKPYEVIPVIDKKL